jgi:hypothetical protein
MTTGASGNTGDGVVAYGGYRDPTATQVTKHMFANVAICRELQTCQSAIPR